MEALKAIRALITREADSMSAMKFRMCKADKALWMDMKFHKKTKELPKEENTEDTGNWCSRVFFILVKDGAGTKKWSMLYMDGKAGIWIS